MQLSVVTIEIMPFIHFSYKNRVLLKIPLILLFLETSECTKVDDVKNQQGIHVSDYCPKSEDCPEGTHVMCMYYKPNKIMGSQCIDPQNVSITTDTAVKILDIVNAIRSKLAFGKEKGKSGEPLPRGYGIMRLKWDSELATFAQVLVNQCLLSHDLCRATKKFREPSQTVGLVRFTRPEWIPVVQNSPFKTPGFNMDKLQYGVVRSIYSWYYHKDSVTPAMIENYPNFTENPANTMGWHYLKMVYGSATHVGCGVAAYAEYSYSQKADVIFNSVQLVCNFSSRPPTGGTVYNKDPPTEVGYTIKCGCPEGFEEDSDCLCNEAPVTQHGTRSCDGINCEPAVVVLPIFTVEDAPRHKFGAKARRAESGPDSDYLHFSDLADNTTSSFQDHNDIFKSIETKEKEPDSETCKDSTSPRPLSSRKDDPTNYNNRIKARSQNSINQTGRRSYRIEHEADAPKSERINETGRRSYRIQPEDAAPKSKRRLLERKERKPPMDVKQRYFGKPPRIQALQRGYDRPQKKVKTRIRPSIFSRVHKFELPGTGTRDGTKLFTVRVTDFKRDVAPRKDFTYSRKLLNNYLNKKRHHEDYTLKTFHLVNYYDTSTLTAFISTTFPSPLKNLNFSNSQQNLNKYMVSKFHYPEFNTSNEPIRKRVDIKNSNEDSDKKLMALLDNLEQEVNHIELNMDEKEIFDAKIRKIYGSVVGRENDLLSSKITNDHENSKKDYTYSNSPIQVLEDLNNKVYDDRIFETEDKVKELHLKLRPGLYSRPVENWRNVQEYDEKNREAKHCNSDSNSCTLGLTDHEDLNRPYFQEKSFKSGDKNYIEPIKKYVEPIHFKDEVRLDNIDINDMKMRNMYEPESDSRKLKDDGLNRESKKNIRYKGQNMDAIGPRHLRRNGYRKKYGYMDKEGPSDALSINRRKQYQQKLDKLERRMHDVRSYRRRNEHAKERAIRLVRPSSRDEVPIRPSVMKSPAAPIYRSPVGPVYMPERARFLHGF